METDQKNTIEKTVAIIELKNNLRAECILLTEAKHNLMDVINRHPVSLRPLKYALGLFSIPKSFYKKFEDESDISYACRLRMMYDHAYSLEKLIKKMIAVITASENAIKATIQQKRKKKAHRSDIKFFSYSAIVPGSSAKDALMVVGEHLLGNKFIWDSMYKEEHINTIILNEILRRYSKRNIFTRLGLWLINHF